MLYSELEKKLLKIGGGTGKGREGEGRERHKGRDYSYDVKTTLKGWLILKPNVKSHSASERER